MAVFECARETNTSIERAETLGELLKNKDTYDGESAYDFQELAQRVIEMAKFQQDCLQLNKDSTSCFKIRATGPIGYRLTEAFTMMAQVCQYQLGLPWGGVVLHPDIRDYLVVSQPIAVF